MIIECLCVILQVSRRLNSRQQDSHNVLVRNLLVRRQFKEASYSVEFIFHITLLNTCGNRFDFI